MHRPIIYRTSVLFVNQNATILFNSSTDAPLEVVLTITAGDSNGQQSPLPHSLEPIVDESIFEVQSTVPGWSPALCE